MNYILLFKPTFWLYLLEKPGVNSQQLQQNFLVFFSNFQSILRNFFSNSLLRSTKVICILSSTAAIVCFQQVILSGLIEYGNYHRSFWKMSSVTETFLKCSLNVNVSYSKVKYGKWKKVGILQSKQLTRNIFVARFKLSCDSHKSEFPMNCIKK